MLHKTKSHHLKRVPLTPVYETMLIKVPHVNKGEIGKSGYTSSGYGLPCNTPYKYIGVPVLVLAKGKS